MKKPNNLTRILSGLVVFALLLTLCVVLGATAAAEEAADPDTCQHSWSISIVNLTDAEKEANPYVIGREKRTCSTCNTTEFGDALYEYMTFNTGFDNHANTSTDAAPSVSDGKYTATGDEFFLTDNLNLVSGGSAKIKDYTISFDVVLNYLPTTGVADNKYHAFFDIRSSSNVWENKSPALMINKDSISGNGYELYFLDNSWSGTANSFSEATGYFMELGEEYSIKMKFTHTSSARTVELYIKKAGEAEYSLLKTKDCVRYYGEGSYFVFRGAGNTYDNFKVSGAFTEVVDPVAVVTDEAGFVAALGNEDITTIKLGADILFADQTETYTIGRAITITSEVKTEANGDTPAQYYSISRVKGGFPMFTANANVTLANVVLDGQNVEDTTSSGGAISSENSSVTITVNEGAVIQNFHAAKGGAIYKRKGYLFINGGKIINNTATDGGAIYMYELYQGHFAMTGGTISGNTATNGGAFYYTTDSNTEADIMVISGGVIELNSATSGGAIFMTDPHWGNRYSFEITGSAVVRKNSATNGGAIFVQNTSAIVRVSGGTIGCANHIVGEHDCGANTATESGGAIYTNSNLVKISGGLISGNKAKTGGGVHINATWGNAGLEMTGGTISGNAATGNGGGISNSSPNAVVSDGIISGNTAAENGAGIYSTGTFTLSGGTVSNNTATVNGGGICSTGTLTISGGTVSGNSAVLGGGLYNSGTVTMSAGVFSGNTSSSTGGAIHNTKTLTIIGGTFSQNTAAGHGGAVYHAGGTLVIGTRDESFDPVTAADEDFTVVFSDNTSTGGQGGALYYAAAATINDAVLFSGNSAGSAGAIAVKNKDRYIYGAKFVGNEAKTYGGAIFVNQSSLHIDGAYFVENHSDSYGGAVCLRHDSWGPSTLWVHSGTFKDNDANNYGGAIACDANYNSARPTQGHNMLYIYDGTFTGNKANWHYGGAVYLNGSVLEMTGGLIENNTAQESGGAIWVSDKTADGEFIMLGGEIKNNTAKVAGSAIYAGTGADVYLLGGKITGHTGTVAAIADNGSNGIHLGSTATYTTIRSATAHTYTSTNPLVILDNTAPVFNAPANTFLINAPVAGSKLVISDNGETEGYAITLGAEYTPDATVLASIHLSGADEGYLIDISESGTTLVWPTEAMQVEMTGGLDVAFTFNLEVFLRDASKRTGLVATFHTENKTHSPVEVVLTAADGIYTNRINPKQIMDAIVFTNGEDELGSYTFADYMDLMRTKYASDADTVALANAILNYGSAAQAYFGHNNSVLANVKYTTEAVGAVDVTPNAPNTFFAGARLYVEDEISILVKIDASKITDVENASVSATLGGSAVTGDDLVYGASGTDYYVLISRIPAAQLLDECVITVNGEVLTYGVADYAYRMQDNAEGGDLAKALYAYAVAVKGYTPVV